MGMGVTNQVGSSSSQVMVHLPLRLSWVTPLVLVIPLVLVVPLVLTLASLTLVTLALVFTLASLILVALVLVILILASLTLVLSPSFQILVMGMQLYKFLVCQNAFIIKLNTYLN